MDTPKLEKILRKFCMPYFNGVYAADQLPQMLSAKPALLVVNTDPGRLPGTHWISIFVDGDGTGEYFDSLAQPPPKNFERYMNEHCPRRWTACRWQLQSVASRFCGHYCVFYCIKRCSGFDIDAICSMFTTDTGLNDVLAHNFVCKYLAVK